MPQCCAVPYCSIKEGGHKFPRDKTVLNQWLTAIRRDNYNPSKHSRVCKKHFNPDDYVLPKESYTENPTPKLKPTAVPSRFFWNHESEEKKEIKRKRTERASQRQKKRGTAIVCSNTEGILNEEHFELLRGGEVQATNSDEEDEPEALSSSPGLSQRPAETPRVAEKRKRRKEDSCLEEVHQAFQAIGQAQQEEDEFDLFGRLMGKKIKTLPDEVRHRAMFKMEEVFMNFKNGKEPVILTPASIQGAKF